MMARSASGDCRRPVESQSDNPQTAALDHSGESGAGNLVLAVPSFEQGCADGHPAEGVYRGRGGHHRACMPVIQRHPGSMRPTTTTPSNTPSNTPTTASTPTSSSTPTTASTARFVDVPAPRAGVVDVRPAGAGPSSLVGVRTGQATLPFRIRPARSSGYTDVDTSTLTAPTRTIAGPVPAVLTMAPGTKVSATINGATVDGTLAGFDYQGRPVLTDQHGARRVAATHDNVRVQQAGSSSLLPSVLASLPAGAVVAPPAVLLQALDAALDTKVVGTHAAREYTDAFTARGFEVFIVGGGVRDAIATLTQNPNATVTELLALLNDVDIVTTAPPPVAREICEQVAPELSGGGVWSPKFVEQFGVVLAGGKKAGLPQSDGLDIATMKHSGMFGEQQHHADTNEKSFPTTFGFDIANDAAARDFCCNALYYDPRLKVVVDPTLQGIADAEHRLLHPTHLDLKAEEATVSARFWKFRLRGFSTDGESLQAIRHHAQVVFSTSTGRDRWRLQNTLGRTAPKDATSPAAVEAWLKDLRRVMHEDHCADLFDRALRGGVRQGVVSEVLKRTQKGANATTPPTTTTTATTTTTTNGGGV